MHEIVDIEPPRSLNQWEREVLEQLLSARFAGRAELLGQLGSVRVIGECQDGCRSVQLAVAGVTAPAVTAERVPVEGQALDEDGVPLLFLLHVVDGFLHELEILRADSRTVRRLPPPDSIALSAEPG